MNDLASENSDLLDKVEKLRDTERRLRDAQQTEKFLKGRVEELEQVRSLLLLLANDLVRLISSKSMMFLTE